MKTTGTTLLDGDTKEQTPIFKITDVDLEHEVNTTPLNAQISFLEIKELYDRAYVAINAGRNDYKSKEMMAEAVKLDMAYHCQLSRNSKYKKLSQINDFKIISGTI